MWLIKKRYGKFLSKTKHRRFGKNFTGQITVRFRGGSPRKPKLIIVDFNRFIWNLPGIITSLEKSYNQSSYLATIVYPCGILTYINAPLGLKPGFVIETGEQLPVKVGNSMLLKNIPLNVKIHNIENYPKSGAKIARAAGTYATIIEKRTKTVVLLLASTNKKLIISQFCLATIGRVSNFLHRSKKYLKKAGNSRLLNKRPRVRGVAKNPVDHPHGGGKGKKSPKNPNYNFVRKLIKGRQTKKKW